MLLFLSSMLHSESLAAGWIAVSQEGFRALKSKGNHKKFEWGGEGRRLFRGCITQFSSLTNSVVSGWLLFLIFDVTGVDLHVYRSWS